MSRRFRVLSASLRKTVSTAVLPPKVRLRRARFSRSLRRAFSSWLGKSISSGLVSEKSRCIRARMPIVELASPFFCKKMIIFYHFHLHFLKTAIAHKTVHRFRIGVLTSGGDCPGLNAVIRATVASAHTLGWEVLGFVDGYEGLLSPVNYKILTPEKTEGITAKGGTIIGTTNKGRFVAKSGHGEKAQIPQPVIDEAKKTIEDLGVRALICIGGDGS